MPPRKPRATNAMVNPVKMTLTVPDDDEIVLDWISAQNNASTSIRLLIKRAVAETGVADYITAMPLSATLPQAQTYSRQMTFSDYENAPEKRRADEHALEVKQAKTELREEVVGLPDAPIPQFVPRTQPASENSSSVDLQAMLDA